MAENESGSKDTKRDTKNLNSIRSARAEMERRRDEAISEGHDSKPYDESIESFKRAEESITGPASLD